MTEILDYVTTVVMTIIIATYGALALRYYVSHKDAWWNRISAAELTRRTTRPKTRLYIAHRR